MRSSLLLLLVGLSVVGCGSMTGLDEKKNFACKAPPGISCASLSGVYANAVADNLPGSKKKAKSIYVSSDKNKVASNVVGEAPATGTPLLSEPKVLRVWVAPWEDSKKVLHDQAYLYAVADPGHWQIAHTTDKISTQYRVLAPLVKNATAGAPAQQTTPAQQSQQPLQPQQ